jgi:3-deoxy-7-phosphoheptulonate synthase
MFRTDQTMNDHTRDIPAPGDDHSLEQGEPAHLRVVHEETGEPPLEAPEPGALPLSCRSSRRQRSAVRLAGDIDVGGSDVVIMAGPCTIESEEQLFETAARVAASGATVLRGGAYKPRTSPYSFQGLGIEGLKMLRAAGDEFGLLTVSEVMDARQIEGMLPYVDILQVGARNMQNFTLLQALGGARRPVLLKRSFSATVDEWLSAAEYVLAAGNSEVILCERGIRTFETATRNTLDISAIPVVRERSHLPLIVDPSHAAGCRKKVPALARAAIAAGADGLLVEVHCNPENALCDGEQSLYPDGFEELVREIRVIASAVGRGVAGRRALVEAVPLHGSSV